MSISKPTFTDIPHGRDTTTSILEKTNVRQYRDSGDLNPLASAILASYSPYYSPYDVISDVIRNPHYSASYPYSLRGTRVGARVTAKARVTRQLAQTQCVSMCDPSVP